MPESQMPLTPDEEQQGVISFAQEQEPSQQLYVLVAAMSGLLLLFLLHVVFIKLSTLMLLNAAVALGVITYIWLLATHAKISMSVMGILAAELGMLFNMPLFKVSYHFWKEWWDFIPLLWWMGFAAIVGGMLCYFLKVEKYPVPVLAINFLSLFVLVGFLFLRAMP